MDLQEKCSAEANRFSDAPISRRGFVRLSAATAGAIALPGEAVARLDAPRSTDRHRFVAEHTEEGYAVPTLVRAGPGALETLEGIDGIDRTTTEPEPAAYGRLTAETIEEVNAVEGVERLEYSPGANPWWRLGAYPEGVFPEPEASVDHIGFEEHVRGMEHLADEHVDRLRFFSIGESPGHENRHEGGGESQPIHVAELTNDVDDRTTFREKETVTFVASIHGDERTGVEAGSRLIERTLAGEEPELDALLDEVALVFIYANPDGWVAREPIYGSDRPAFQRTTATGGDPARQYPTAGWIDPNHDPAEPDGANLTDDQPGEIDDDVPDRIAERVPDTLSIVEHLRTYENANYVVDLHGMQWSDEFVLGLVPDAGYDHETLQDVDAMNRSIERAIEGELGAVEENVDALSRGAERYDAVREETAHEMPDAEGMLPDRWYDWGTIHDTLGYGTTGGLIAWAAHPEEFGGLGARSVGLEIAFATATASMEREYAPELVGLQVRTYAASIRAVADHAASEASAWIETGDRSTAVVHADARTRSSADLEFAETTDEEVCRTVTVDAGGFAEEVAVDEGTWELSITANPREDVALEATLLDPNGDFVRTHRPNDERDGPDWTIGRPEPGTWTIRLEDFGPNADAGGGAVELCTDALVAESDGVPNPRDVVGYTQRDYEATPFEYFESYAEHARVERGGASATFDTLSIEEVRDGALLREGDAAYDDVVVIHDEGDDAYVEELSALVEAGGSLLLTDGGVSLLEGLDDGLADSVASDRRAFAALDEKHDHPLLEGARSIQDELWTVAPMGYATDEEAPVTLVEREAFEAAGGTVGATMEPESESEDEAEGESASGVAVGSLSHGDGEIHVVGSLFPTARQSHLHPFGVLDHSTTMLGHTLVTNALGHRRRRSVDES